MRKRHFSGAFSAVLFAAHGNHFLANTVTLALPLTLRKSPLGMRAASFFPSCLAPQTFSSADLHVNLFLYLLACSFVSFYPYLLCCHQYLVLFSEKHLFYPMAPESSLELSVESEKAQRLCILAVWDAGALGSAARHCERLRRRLRSQRSIINRGKPACGQVGRWVGRFEGS